MPSKSPQPRKCAQSQRFCLCSVQQLIGTVSHLWLGPRGHDHPIGAPPDKRAPGAVPTLRAASGVGRDEMRRFADVQPPHDAGATSLSWASGAAASRLFLTSFGPSSRPGSGACERSKLRHICVSRRTRCPHNVRNSLQVNTYLAFGLTKVDVIHDIKLECSRMLKELWWA